MTSVIAGTTGAGPATVRAPRNLRVKNSQPSTTTKRDPQNAGIFQDVSEVVGWMEKCREIFQYKDIKFKDVLSAIPNLSANLKVYGPQLEANHKDQLDRLFVEVRNLSKDVKLDKISRLYLLELVELRACKWSLFEEASSFYKTKLAELMGETNDATQYALTSPSVQQQQPAFGSLYSDRNESNASPPPILLPGETVKFSGKYSGGQPVIPAPQQKAQPSSSKSTFIKDEVVIRNSDSGKVNPGAKERLVQITGPGHENIEQARQLIEQTIQRNASPVRPADSGHGSDLLQSAGQKEEDSAAYGIQHSGRQFTTADDVALDRYRYTVSIGDEVLYISGKNLSLVQDAKLTLDEHFSALLGDRKRTASSSSSADDGMGSLPSPRQLSPRESGSSDAAKPIQPSSRVMKYNRETLLQWANSPLCIMPPPNVHLLHQNAPEILRKVNGAAQVGRGVSLPLAV